MDDEFGLKKLDRDLKKALDVDLGFDDPKIKTKRHALKNKNHYPQTKKPKPLLTKENRQEIKKTARQTKSLLDKLAYKIKNRKIIRLENQYEKTRKERDALAHKIKLKMQISDNQEDIKRYQKELGKLDDERD